MKSRVGVLLRGRERSRAAERAQDECARISRAAVEASSKYQRANECREGPRQRDRRADRQTNPSVNTRRSPWSYFILCLRLPLPASQGCSAVARRRCTSSTSDTASGLAGGFLQYYVRELQESGYAACLGAVSPISCRCSLVLLSSFPRVLVRWGKKTNKKSGPDGRCLAPIATRVTPVRKMPSVTATLLHPSETL